MAEILTTRGFWLSLIAPIVFVFVLVFLIGHSWRKDTRAKKLRADAFSGPATAAITVSGIVLPLIAALIAYSHGTLQQPAQELAPLVVSMVFFTLSVLVGLWVCFGLATIVEVDGTFPVTADLNTYYPATLVSQFLYLFSGVILLVIYSFTNLFEGPSAATPLQKGASTVSIVKPSISTGMSGADVTTLWGRPEKMGAIMPGTSHWEYRSPQAVYLLVLKDNQVVEVVERKNP